MLQYKRFDYIYTVLPSSSVAFFIISFVNRLIARSFDGAWISLLFFLCVVVWNNGGFYHESVVYLSCFLVLGYVFSVLYLFLSNVLCGLCVKALVIFSALILFIYCKKFYLKDVCVKLFVYLFKCSFLEFSTHLFFFSVLFKFIDETSAYYDRGFLEFSCHICEYLFFFFLI